VFLIFLKYSVLRSTVKTRRVNVVSDITVWSFVSKFTNSLVILPLLLFFIHPQEALSVHMQLQKFP